MIDFHAHMFPDKIADATLSTLSEKCQIKPYTNGRADGLLSSSKDAGLDFSVVLPVVTKPSQFKSITDFAAQFLDPAEGILSFGGIHPESAHIVEELNTLKEMGFKGIKLHPAYQETPFNDIRYKRILYEASERDLIVTVHAGYDPAYPNENYCAVPMIKEVIRDVHPTKLVLAHMGGMLHWDEVEEGLVGEEVWLDTAVVFGKIPDDQFIRICRNHGTDRILFGTDSPWSGQKESVEYFQNLDLTDQEKQQILTENARNLLTL